MIRLLRFWLENCLFCGKQRCKCCVECGARNRDECGCW